MKPVLLVAAMLILGVLPGPFATPVLARTVNCVPDSGCPKDEGPPSCCQPPPCEFVQALKFERANRDNILSNMLVFAGEEGGAAEGKWAARNFQDFSDLVDQASPCPENVFFEPEPILTVDEENQCEITVFGNEVHGTPSLEELHDTSNTCEELVDAEYREAEASRQICLVELYRTAPRTLQERMQQDLAQANAKLDELETQQRNYESLCTVAPDGETAQQAVEDDLVPLLADPKPKAKKKKAKRSGKKAGRK